jgi:hypothetical protein
LAAGLAIGFAGSALAANPTVSPGYSSMMGSQEMMGSQGMMGGASFAPGSTFGPGMMGSFSPEQLQRCDQMHDAMHAAASPSTSLAPR